MSAYWTQNLEAIFDDHGIEATAAQIEAVARDVAGAASVEYEYSAESVQVGHGAPEKSEDQKRIEKMERIIRALSDRLGVSVDEHTMEVLVRVPCGNSHMATDRIPLRHYSAER